MQMSFSQILTLILLIAAILLLLILLMRLGRMEKHAKEEEDALREERRRENADAAARVTATVGALIQPIGASLTDNQRQAADAQHKQLAAAEQHLKEGQTAFQNSLEAQMNQFRLSLLDQFHQLRQDNEKKLDEIRGTVDEKLQDALNKRITESFKTVSLQLEQVYKGLGEMQTLAADVGSLKKVLAGVKTRGILGEIQLQAILTEILSPGQYDVNVATIPGSTERVEFAVKLPGTDQGTVYLPIDSKFPGDTYAALRDAQESGDRTAILEAYHRLEAVIRAEAKDICSKYVAPPYTTNFGVMFLPVEGLYAEVVSHGLLEELQVKYHVNVAGPSTMAALLNSLQMGFKTLAIQKRSNDVWQILGEVKAEFATFEGSLSKMQQHLQQTSSDLDKLIGVRTRAIQRKLRTVQEIDTEETEL